MKNYTNLEEYINNLITKNNSYTEFLELKTESPKTEQWDELINFLHLEGNNGSYYLGHYPIWESDFGSNSLYKFLDTKVDLDDINIEGELKGKKIWNESLQNIIDKYILIKQADDDTSLGLANYVYTDIFKADAGNSFEKVKEWVKSWKNIDKMTYTAVRDNNEISDKDKVLSVLTNQKNLQFTREVAAQTLRPFLRLIMPKNTRRVEIEDLNRNFWVIGQTLTCLSWYLFDENSPWMTIFKGFLDEILQLWENVMFLWATLFLLAHKPYYTEIHTEIVELPSNTIQSYRKFDNIRATLDLSIIKTRLEYLIQKYSTQHLCLLISTRGENYQHNYYKQEYYPYVLLYNRNSSSWKVYTLNNANNNRLFISVDNTNGTNLSSKILGGAIYNEKIYYGTPFSHIEDLYETKRKIYYAALRTIPSILASFNKDENELYLNSLSFKVYDGINDIVYGSSKEIIRLTANIDENTLNVTFSNSNIASNLTNSDEISYKEFQKGWYLGEMASSRKTTAEAIDDVITETIRTFKVSDVKTLANDAYMIKVGNYFPPSLNPNTTGISTGYSTINFCSSRSDDKIGMTFYYNNGNVFSSSYILNTTQNNNSNYYWWNTTDDNGEHAFGDKEILTRSQLMAKAGIIKDSNDNYGKAVRCLIRKIRQLNPTKITYFVTTIGVNAWIGDGAALSTGGNLGVWSCSTDNMTRGINELNGTNKTHHGSCVYWAGCLMTHMYKFIPQKYRNEYSGSPLVTIQTTDGSKTLGILVNQVEIGKVEYNASVLGLSLRTGSSTTWRIPQIVPITSATNYFAYEEKPQEVHTIPIKRDSEGNEIWRGTEIISYIPVNNEGYLKKNKGPQYTTAQQWETYLNKKENYGYTENSNNVVKTIELVNEDTFDGKFYYLDGNASGTQKGELTMKQTTAGGTLTWTVQKPSDATLSQLFDDP